VQHLLPLQTLLCGCFIFGGFIVGEVHIPAVTEGVETAAILFVMLW
jgi:hypothetical protein